MILSPSPLDGRIWLSTRPATDSATNCEKFLGKLLIALSGALLLVSLAEMCGAWSKNSYLLVMFLLIILLFCFTVFAFVVTNKGVRNVVSGRGYEEYRLGDYSNWLQRRVENSGNWRRMKGCLQDSKVCQSLADNSLRQAQFFHKSLLPIQVTSSFVGMHCIFDSCKASVMVVKFGHMSSDLLAYGASDGTLTVCTVSHPLSMVHLLKGHTRDVTDFDFSSNNQYIASTSMDKTVRVWEMNKGHCILVIYGTSSQNCIPFKVNNNVLSIGNANREIIHRTCDKQSFI